MTVTARLYFEAHVTIEPVFDDRRDQARILAECWRFRLAELLMQKRTVDTEERSAKDTFMTGHGKNLSDLRRRMAMLVGELRAAGFKVWRYKIEDTVVDSRVSDEYRLLGWVAP